MPARRSQAESLARETDALQLRRNGATYPQIAERLGLSTSGAHEAVKRALDRTLTEAAPDVRKLELERLDSLLVTALTVLARPHPLVQGGRVVLDQQGQPLRDDGPTLAALDRVLKIQERRARLLGLDAPTKLDMKVMTIDQLDDRIAELTQLLADNDSLPQLSQPTGGT
jgi:hypothetical protein